MIIDCHVHVNNYENENEDLLQERLDELQKTMRRNRVDISLILTSYKVVPGRPSTKAVVEKIRGSKSLYVVAGLSYLNFTQYELDEIKEFIQEGTVVGLKLYPGYEPFYPADKKLTPVYSLAAEMHVPIMIHCGDTYTPKGKLKYSHPLNIDEVAVEHPDINFLICHLGNPWMRDTMEVVYKNSNVYTDISGLVLGNFSDRFEKFMHKQLQEMMVWGVEPSKCLYGTDWPISSMESYLDFMDSLGIPQRDKEKMMFENAVSFFRLPVSTAPPSGIAGKFPFLKSII
ncbi:MAG: amidohydrolase [Bacteroidetes bacterium]|nr:amidohydrolase [Bacteroidota bacterium]